MEAKFKTRRIVGTRVVAAEKFYLDYFLVDLKRGEYLAEINIPKPKPKTGSAFVNIKRTATDISLVNAAVRLQLSYDGKIEEASVGLGGMGNIPIKANAIEPFSSR